jgi:hypothetical protein
VGLVDARTGGDRQAEKAESAAYAAMLDEETGLRGYLMTNDAQFLEAYVHGEHELVAANDSLTPSTAAVPELATALVQTRLAEERWRDGWAEVAASDTKPNTGVPSLSGGKALFDAYRREQAVLCTIDRRV